ncbi:restriction endonuclease [Paenibacillus sp. GCM10012306]|uniref:restriction endonuclease n=1 Tax=Paenibacillus sp. GCM10012306 TaxID=3317342 RepID=UPI00360DBB31
MIPNPHLQYELLAKEIYETLHNEEGVRTISIQHNVKVPGKSGCEHQIDVYWEFEMVGEIHRIAVECKNYTREVSIGKIRDFFGVVHDLGNNTKGIFVTKVGYQSGAKKFGEYYGISLKEMRFPEDKDWEGLIRDFEIRGTFLFKKITHEEPNYDSGWILENTRYREGDRIMLGGMADQVIIYDGDDNAIKTYYDLQNELPTIEEAENLEHVYKFENAYIYDINKTKLKIKSIKFRYNVISSEIVSKIEGEKVAKAILKDVKTDEIYFFNKKGDVK